MDVDEIQYLLEPKLNYWIAAILIAIGLFAMVGKRNLLKKLIGMTIFQAAIILFYVSMAVKEGATIPILPHDLTQAAHEHRVGTHHHIGTVERPHREPIASVIDPDDYSNPLPHVLMLTAIVVGVATLGVALATTQIIFAGFKTLEEPEINEILRREIEGEE